MTRDLEHITLVAIGEARILPVGACSDLTLTVFVHSMYSSVASYGRTQNTDADMPSSRPVLFIVLLPRQGHVMSR